MTARRRVAIFVACAAAGLLAALFVPWRLARMRDEAFQVAAQSDLVTIAEVVRQFRQREGRLPSLIELARQSEQEPWADPWGHAFELEPNADDPAHGCTLRSLGADGQRGTADDIVVVVK